SRALRAQLDALIQSLCHTHCAAYVKAQPCGSLLLQSACRERWIGVFLSFFLLERSNRPGSLGSSFHDFPRRPFVWHCVRNKLISAILALAVRHPRRLSVYSDKP